MSKITKPPKRLTIVIDSEIDSKLREIHGQLIAADSRNYSFSKVVNLMLLAGIISADRLDQHQWHMIKASLEHKKVKFDEIMSREFLAKIAETSELV